MPASHHSLESERTTLHDLPMTTLPIATGTFTTAMVSDRGKGQEEQPDLHTTPKAFARLEQACLNLSPSFFSLNMGTGIASILLYNLPYNAQWVKAIGIAIFVLNIALFAMIALGSIIRYIRWKGIFTVLNKHLLAGMYWGCLPMGLVTIVNMVALVCAPKWGYRWAQLSLGLWWIDVLMAILVNFGMIFMIFTRQQHTIETISAALLLPVVSSVVAAASGGVVARAILPFDPPLARSTVIVSYVVWGTGVPVALFLITLWIYRTAIVGLPAPTALPSLFLPLGPCGQGSYGIILLGSVVRDLAYQNNLGFTIAPLNGTLADSTLRIADAIYAGGLVTGLILWGLGLVWYTLGMTITINHILHNKVYLHHRSFSIGWTAYTFPIGVWATATTQLAKELDSPAFRVIGMVVSLQVVLQWAYVFGMSCWKAWNGALFMAPELNEWTDRRPPLRWRKETTAESVVQKGKSLSGKT